MIKKMLITLLLFNAILFAETINLRSVQGDYSKGKITFIISANDENSKGFPRKNSKDWVGLYKKGDSNDWENVLTWGWAKDFGSERDGDAILTKNVNLTEGEYEVRYFLNNSFTTYKEGDFFSFNWGGKHREVRNIDYIHEKKVLRIQGNVAYNFRVNAKDWIAIYKAKDNNSWKNVIEWKWAKDTHFDLEQDIGNPWRLFKLTKNYDPKIKYEARYFLNNSFTTYKKSQPFTVSSEKDINMNNITGSYKNGKIKFHVSLNWHKPFNPGKKDWVALYKKSNSNAWKNVLTWAWVKDFNQEYFSETELEKNINLPAGEYEVRYFRDNSFSTYKKGIVTFY